MKFIKASRELNLSRQRFIYIHSSKIFGAGSVLLTEASRDKALLIFGGEKLSNFGGWLILDVSVLQSRSKQSDDFLQKK